MAEYGNRELGIIQDALQEIYEELSGDASVFRENLLKNLMQGTDTGTMTIHFNAIEDAYQPLQQNFGNLNLQTMVNYAFANLEVLEEMQQLDKMTNPDQMWTGYYETSEAIEEIAQALNEGFDFELDTNQSEYELLREMLEQLEGSNIKVQDVPLSLDLQMRVLDDMKYFELGSLQSAFHSTEVMRPFTVQLIEIYNQIEDLPEDLVSNLHDEIANNLGLKEMPNDYLRAYDNPNNSEAKAVKNVIKYFFEQLGRQQNGYMDFSSVDNMMLDGGVGYSHIESADSVASFIGELMQDNLKFFLPNSNEPVELLNSIRPFESIREPWPRQISAGYINEYNNIIGTTIIKNPIPGNYTTIAFADMNNLVTGEPLTVGEIARELGLPERLHTIDLPSTPTNVVDEGIELYHSISKGQTVNKKFHAGTYNAALDRASQFYGGEQLYKIANDNLNFIQEQVNDLVSELSEQVSFEKVEDFYEVTDGMVTREITITLPTGVEADFNIVAETSNNDLTVKFQDLDGYDGAEIYSETLWDIENKPNSLKSFTSTINIIDDENVAVGLLDEIGLKSQAGDFNLRNGYDLYKVNINPSANVVNIPNTAIFVENGIKKEMSSDFIQGFIERPETVNQYKNVEQIIIDGKSYDITDNFTSAQALQEHFKDADVLVYTNDIEDVGSKSYIFMNENSYVLEKIDDAQFNVDVANKYIKNNPYETISKLAREEAFSFIKMYDLLPTSSMSLV